MESSKKRKMKQKESKRKIRCFSAVSLVCVITSILMNAKSKILYFYPLWSHKITHFIVSFLQTSPGEYVCPACLVSKAFMWNIQSNIYEVRHHTACVTANFQLKYLILKANAIEASCSWSRNTVVSFHHAVLCWKSLVHPLSDSAISVWLAVGDPWASKIHWSSANICQAWRPMSITTSAHHISTNLFMNAPFVVDMMENVCCHQSVLAQWRPPTQPPLIPYHCFNAVCRGKGIRWPTGLWHLVSTISLRRRWDLWNGSHTCTWVLLKPPVKATWP